MCVLIEANSSALSLVSSNIRPCCSRTKTRITKSSWSFVRVETSDIIRIKKWGLRRGPRPNGALLLVSCVQTDVGMVQKTRQAISLQAMIPNAE